MSDFIAEARVLITPDTTKFRALLEEQLAAQTAKPVVVPVQFAAVGGAAGVAEQAAAQENLAGATTRARVATADAAKVEAANTEIRARLATVTDVAALKVSDLAKANAVYGASNKIVTASEKNKAAALTTEIPALEAATAETEALAVAQATAARTAVVEAAAMSRASGAAAATASSHALAAKGVGATGLSLLGARGATLAASSSFLIGAAAATIMAKSIGGASGLNEEINKTRVTFPGSADAILTWSKTTATSLGIARVEALRAAGEFGNMLEPLGVLPATAARMSTRLVELASDLASFHNADPTDMLERLRAGLAGQSRPLRIFGIQLLASRVNQEALNETGKKSVRQLTEQEKVLARFNLILKDSKNAQGDFNRTADQAANQSRVLKAQLADLGDELGTKLLPGVTQFVRQLNKAITIMQEAGKEAGDLKREVSGLFPQSVNSRVEKFGGSLLHAAAINAGVFIPGLDAAIKLFPLFGDGAKKAADDTVDAFDRINKAVGDSIKGLIAALSQAQIEMSKGLPLTISTQIEVEQARGGTGLALLQERLASEEKFLEKLLAGPKDPKHQALIRKAAANVERDRAAIQRILDDQASAAKKQAQDAADAQTKATEAFINAFAPQQQRLENRITVDQNRGALRAAIRDTNALIAFFRRERAEIARRIKQMHLHGDALKAAKAAITALTQDIFDQRQALADLVQEQAKQREANKQLAIEARQSHLEALLAIAEARDDPKRQAAAIEALIRFDENQIRRLKKLRHRTREQNAELDAYRVDLAQREKALRDIKKQTDKNAQAFKEQQFAFLQTQTGFAFNLLGNLIPGGATAGLVGGRGGGVPSPRETAVRLPVPGQRTTAIADSRITRGVTIGQGNEQIHLLRSIFKELRAANRLRDHPEAHGQRRRSAAIMDTAGSRGM